MRLDVPARRPIQTRRVVVSLMVSPRRIPLNPCDYLYYAHHRMLRRTAGSGSLAYMVLETSGHVEPDRVRDSLAAAMTAHPVTVSPLRISLLTGRPYWQVPHSPGAAVREAVDQAFVCDDLRPADGRAPVEVEAASWQERLEQLCLQRYAPLWDLQSGAHLRFEQYLLPDGRTRFRLLWPHFLMDAEGAQWFLREIDRHCSMTVHPSMLPSCNLHTAAQALQPGTPSAALADGLPIDLLAGHSLAGRLRLFRRGFALQPEHKELAISPLASDASCAVTSLGLIHRHWSGPDLDVVHASAKRVTPSGPALYARYLAACVIRALHRLHVELGRESGGYLITFPMRPAAAPDLDTRTVNGNYLVSPLLWTRREQALDRAALAAAIHQQLDDYRRKQGDLSQWAQVWAASFLRASFYDLIFRLPLGFERLSSGFSYYGEIRPPLRTFCGAPIINFYGGGPLGTPPGWNPVFSRWHDRLNLSLTWNRPHITEEAAARYAALIEEEMFATG